MSTQEIVELFSQVNAGCLNNGEEIVPLTRENYAYYETQCENLEIEGTEFLDWLVVQ